MSNVDPFCVFCSKKSGKLNLFDTDKLNKCIGILKIRKDAGLSLANVILPEQANNFQKYHSQCHNRFTALPPKQRGYDPKKQASSSSRRDQNDSAVEEEHGVGNEGFIEGVDGGQGDAAVEGDDIDQGEVYVGNEENVDAEDENVDVGDDVARGEDVVEEDNVAGVDDVEESGRVEEVSENTVVCVFCNKNRKKHQGREQQLHLLEREKALKSIRQFAMDLNDIEFVEKLHILELQEKLIFYHAICRKKYEHSSLSNKCKDKPKTAWHTARDVHRKAYEEICKFVSENIIKRNQSFFLAFLNTIFIDYLKGHKADTDAYTTKPYHLENRLLSTFAKKITIISHNHKKLVKPYGAEKRSRYHCRPAEEQNK